MYTYYIDRKGGRHFHMKGCVMTVDSQFHYEAVERQVVHGYNDRIRDGGKYYRACPGCIRGRRIK